MSIKLISLAGILSVFTGTSLAEPVGWLLMDNFQQFSDGQILYEPTDIGWHGSSSQGTDEYWFIRDPNDPANITLYVQAGQGAGYSNVWIQKELPGGGIAPGETGTLFLRSLWTGPDNQWNVGTADRELQYDPVTGKQTIPGAWGDFNALIRTGVAQNIEHRDGGGYVSTNPPLEVESNQWYSFWLVVENTWDMSTTPPTSTGVYTLYMQGPDIGNGDSPTLISVGTDPPKDKASIRRAPMDEDGNPQPIIWLQFATNSGAPGTYNSDPCLLDDFYFSQGENLTDPLTAGNPLIPGAPANLEAVILSDSRIQLNWLDTADTETGFKVLMKIGLGGDWIEVADIPEANASGCLLEDIAVGQNRFIVQAYNAEGGFRNSNVVTATWGNPILSNANLNQSNWWELGWFGEYVEYDRDWILHQELGVLYLNGQDASGFHLYSTDMECWFWTSGGLYPFLYKFGDYEGWYYYYRGEANGDRWFARLADETFVRAAYINESVPQPAAPTNLVAMIYGDSQVQLSWEDNADDEMGYRLFMQAGDDGEWTELVTLSSKNQKHYILTDVDTTTPLRFQVQAYTAGNESEFSNIALADDSGTGPGVWVLLDNFQRFEEGQIFLDATEIGWHASCPDDTDEYWMLGDPHDEYNITLFVESGNYGVGYGNVWMQKALPGGGIFPGETGTLFLRCLWSGIDKNWHVGTADRDLEYDAVTGLQTVPGAWGDFNALIRTGVAQNIEHRDGGGYVSTDPPQVVNVNIWYSFWMVVENTWDMSTSPPTCTGVYTLYVQGAGFGDGVSPTLISVGTDPPKDKAFLRRAPVDDDGNPQPIIWLQFATNSGAPGSPSAGDPYLLDDFYFSQGENLSSPVN